MKSHWMLPIAALAGGFAAFVLRVIQNRTGFIDELPIPGCPAAAALVILLALLCVLLFFLSRSLSGAETLPSPADSPAYLILPSIGCFLFLLAGALDVYEGLTGENLMEAVRAALFGDGSYLPALLNRSDKDRQLSALLQALCGFLLLGGGAGMLCLLSLFRPGCDRTRQTFRNELLLLIPVSMVVRLVILYRKECVNPIMQDYAVGLVSLMTLSLALFSLISFQFRQGSPRSLAFYTGCSVVCCLCSLADSPSWLSTVLLNLGGPLLLLGFLPLFLWREETASR